MLLIIDLLLASCESMTCRDLYIEWLREMSFAIRQWYFWVAKLWNDCMEMGANRPYTGYWAFTKLINRMCYLQLLKRFMITVSVFLYCRRMRHYLHRFLPPVNLLILKVYREHLIISCTCSHSIIPKILEMWLLFSFVTFILQLPSWGHFLKCL